MLAGTTWENDGIPWEEAVKRGGGQGSVWPPGRLAPIFGLPLWTIPYLEILPGLCPGGSERAWTCLSWSFIPFRLGASSSFSTAPTSGPGWAQHQLGQSAAKSPSPSPALCPQPRVWGWGTCTLSHTHGATPSTEPPTCPGQPKPIQPCSSNATLTLQATRVQRCPVGGEFKASPGGLRLARTGLPFSPDTSRGHGSPITISAIALGRPASLSRNLGPPQPLPYPYGVAADC